MLKHLLLRKGVSTPAQLKISAAAICGHCQYYHYLVELLRGALRGALRIAKYYRTRIARPVSESVRSPASPLVISLSMKPITELAHPSPAQKDTVVTAAYHQDSRPGQVDMMALIDRGAPERPDPHRRLALDSFTCTPLVLKYMLRVDRWMNGWEKTLKGSTMLRRYMQSGKASPLLH